MTVGKGRLSALIGGAILSLMAGGTAFAQNDAALIVAVDGAKAPLDYALRASESQGTAVSARYELQESQLVLSVYTTKAGRFFEVLVDPKTGKILKTEPITGGDDLDTVKAQTAAFAKGNELLRAALARVLKKNRGAKAVSITPKLEAGKAVASVTLVAKKTIKTVSERLK